MMLLKYIGVFSLLIVISCDNYNDIQEQKVDSSNEQDTLSCLFKPVNEYVLSNVKTMRPRFDSAIKEIIVSGRITQDPRQLAVVSARVTGRIEKLYVKYKFQPVSKGQKLMEIYSPELLTEQENYIHLIKSGENNVLLIKAVEERLLLLGLSIGDLQKLRERKKAFYTIAVYSSYNGYLYDGEIDKMQLMNMQDNDELSIKEGMYVQMGAGVFTIYDINRVWALLDVRPEEGVFVKPGMTAIVYSSTGDSLTYAKIDFVEPVIRENTFYTSIRIYLDNKEKNLIPGTIITAKIKSKDRKGVLIPPTAIVHLGKRSIVFLKENNVFRSRQVQIGSRINNMIEIISGVDSSTVIAENAQLLVDSESFIKISNDSTVKD